MHDRGCERSALPRYGWLPFCQHSRMSTATTAATTTSGPGLAGIHHVAIIASDYAVSRHFYTQVLGLRIVHEVYRQPRDSWKLDLALADGSQIELFSFPSPPPRASRPEARGLRHLAFRVEQLEAAISHLDAHGVACEPIRTDEYTGRRFTFFADPDQLPLELYEQTRQQPARLQQS
jgi:glyoxylase I family protein